MGARRVELLLVAALAALATGAAFAGEEAAPWRALLAVPLVLFLPGYALTAAVFPDGGGAGRPAERILLGIGLSLALAATSGVALDRTPGGLQAASWALLLGGLTLGATAAALARGAWGPSARGGTGGSAAAEGAGAAGEGTNGASAGALPSLSVGQGLLLAGAALTVVAAVAIARRGAEAEQASAGFTQLWLLPPEAGRSEAGSPGPGGAPGGALRLGVRSGEPRSVTYALRVTVDGVQTQAWTAITLAPGQTWETDLAPAPPGAVEAVLSRAEASTTVYRRVTLHNGPGPGA